MLFSATYKGPVIEFATKIVKEPMIIRLRRQDESLSAIKQFYVKCSNFETKYKSLSNIYGLITVGQSIIFCQVIEDTIKRNNLGENLTDLIFFK
jgi:ATP-dependent RNA helicase DDX19/DBP5